MRNRESMLGFIIKFVYVVIWTALIYCVLKYALPYIMPFFIAFVIAFILKPLINFLTKKSKLSRRVSSIIVLTFVYLVIGSLLTLLGIKIVVSLGNLFSHLPLYYAKHIEPAFATMTDWFDGFISRLDPSIIQFINSALDSISSTISNLVSAISQGALSVVTGIASGVPWFVVSLIITIISSYFFVIDYYKITAFLSRQLSERVSQLLFKTKDYVVNVLFKFARAYGTLLTLTFVELTIGLLILRVQYAIPIAFVIAIMDILPVIGTGTFLIPWAVYSLFTGKVGLGVGLLIIYVVITVVRQVLEPRVVGKQIGLYPLLTLICMFLGGRLFGFWGLFGLPIAVTVLIHLNREGEIHIFKE